MNERGASEGLPPLVLLAGGLATRLHPLTETIAKSMVNVAGEPFIAHQLRMIAHKGIHDVVICIGNLGGQIESFVGDGAWAGCRVRYSHDGCGPLGTGGALRRALPILGECFFVMYGDSYLEADFALAYEAFRCSGLPAMMTVFRNEGRWDTSNVEYAAGMVLRYDKIHRTEAMHHIDYGLGIFKAEVLGAYPQAAFDLAEVYRKLAGERMLAGYEVAERFYEVGSPAGLAETDSFLRERLSRVK